MSTAVRRALYGRLTSNSTLINLLGAPAAGYTQSIYHRQAPAGAAFPFIVFQQSSGIPTETFGPKNTIAAPVAAAMTSYIWLVKAIDRNASADAAEGIAAQLVTVLNDAPLSISGKSLLYLRKESDVEYAEIDAGVTYHHVGGLFRLTTD
jgi:hypothetical protein